MTASTFVDANVFVYAHDERDSLKQSLARSWIQRLWREGTGRTSTQVLNEFYVNATRKLQPALSPDEARLELRRLFLWKPQAMDIAILQRAQTVEERYRLNWWDCLIVAAAQAQGCTTLLTEDLQDRAIYGGVRVHNPFTWGVSEPVGEYVVTPAGSAESAADARWSRAA